MSATKKVISKAAILRRTVWGDLIREINDELRKLNNEDALEYTFETKVEANSAGLALRKQLSIDFKGRPTNVVTVVRGKTVCIYQSTER